jgi:hypothetical protein
MLIIAAVSGHEHYKNIMGNQMLERITGLLSEHRADRLTQ